MQPHATKHRFFYALVLVFTCLNTSCSKDHDLISEYVVSDTSLSSLEQKTTTTLLADAQKPKQGEQSASSTGEAGK